MDVPLADMGDLAVGGDRGSAGPVDGDAVVWCRSGRNVSGVPLDDLLVQAVRIACGARTAATGGLAVVGPGGEVRAAVAADEMAWEIETASYLAGTGPGPTSMELGRPVPVRDMVEAIEAYPIFARAALERAMFSSFSLPLMAGGTSLGALTLYAESRDALDGQAIENATAVAAIASCLIVWTDDPRVEEVRDLLRAVVSRSLVGQATGIMMARTGCTADEAVEELHVASMRQNRPMVEVATEIIEGARPAR